MKRKAAPQQTKIRIIAGKHRGRGIIVPDKPGLRPSPNRVRETLFNWLQFEIAGAAVLDAFAGSGALGLEALSRGAGSVLFCDQDADATDAIRTLLHDWKETHARVTRNDATRLNANATRYDLIFLDPPFALNAHQAMLAKFCRPEWLKPHGRIYLELPFAHAQLSLPEGASWQKTARAGAVHYGLIQRDDL